MLHELLLSLSGHPSPLLSGSLAHADVAQNHGLNSLLAPAEIALLQKLSLELGQKNRYVHDNASKISTSHPSIVCRAVAASIISVHLASFQRKILEVERSILQKSPKVVGAYNAVPLSIIVSAFDGWDRRLQWLWEIVQYIRDYSGGMGGGHAQTSCTAAAIIQRVRDAAYTGFPDIEAMALDLARVAEMAWLKQLSSWVLYGKHPGSQDFLITREEISAGREVFGINMEYSPLFVTTPTANSILFLGKSLNHIKERQSSTLPSSNRTSLPDISLLPHHLSQLSSLTSPINTVKFSASISAIRISLSQNALQKLLPLSKVVETLHVLRDFFLLERGEFAVALITAADNRLSHRSKGAIEKQKQGKDTIDNLANLTIRDGEVHNVLSRTWTAMASLDDLQDESTDEELDRARDLITLSIKGLDMHEARDKSEQRSQGPSVVFDDLLLPSPTILGFRVFPPIDLFLSSTDIEIYSHVHSYLLAIRRCHLRLTRLFQLSMLRREQRVSKDSLPPHRSHELLNALRQQSAAFAKKIRPVWATIGSAVFFFAEVGEYLQGEVVRSSWAAFSDWVTPTVNVQTSVSRFLSFSPRSWIVSRHLHHL